MNSNKVDPQVFSESILALLQQDPRRYLNFGVYWYFVKALLKRYYSKDNLSILGDYFNPDTMARMPEFSSIADAMEASIAEYRTNASFNLSSAMVNDPVGGGEFLLNDEDF